MSDGNENMNDATQKNVDDHDARKIELLKQFLYEDTIKFILENNGKYIEKISVESLGQSARFYSAMEGFDYSSAVKWYPIMLDFNRFNILMDFYASLGMTIEDAAETLGRSSDRDFEMADLLSYKNFQVKSKNHMASSDDLKPFVNHSKADNETFNKMLDRNIKKYDSLLRKLK